jgi:hypothetical protein
LFASSIPLNGKRRYVIGKIHSTFIQIQGTQKMETTRLPGAADLRAEVQSETLVETTAGIAAAAVAAALHALECVEFGDSIPVEKQFYSLGWCCQHFQCSPDQLRRFMRAGNIQFAEARNEIAYLDGTGLLALAKFIRSIRAALEAK